MKAAILALAALFASTSALAQSPALKDLAEKAKAIELHHYTDVQMFAKEEALTMEHA